MKKITLFLIFLLLAVVYSTAQKSVALHSNGTTTIFDGDTSLTEAYDASITGDTLYVSGGHFTAPATIDKGLVIIGAGYNLVSTAVTQKTYILNTSNINLGANASNLYLEGMEFAAGFGKGTSGPLNFSFIRCKINGGLNFTAAGGAGPPTNASIIQCDIALNMNLSSLTYSVISNCIIREQIASSVNNIIKNNILLVGVYPTAYCSLNTFYNNIFSANVNQTYVYGSGSNNDFQYNIFAWPDPSLGTTPIDLNNYKGIDVSTVYVNASEGDFHLLGDASTTYLGDDGTEVGIYGGLVPFKEGAVPINPHISQKSIQTTTNSNGFLNISFTVEAQQN